MSVGEPGDSLALVRMRASARASRMRRLRMTVCNYSFIISLIL